MTRALCVFTLLVFAGYSTYRGFQAIAIVSLMGMLGLAYKSHALRFLDLAFSLMAKTREAKYGDAVVKIGGRELNLPQLESALPWVRLVLSSLSNQEISLLVQASSTDSYQIHSAHKNSMRNLRSHGLIVHNEPTMAASTEVSLTERGRDLALFLDQNALEDQRSEQDAANQLPARGESKP